MVVMTTTMMMMKGLTLLLLLLLLMMITLPHTLARICALLCGHLFGKSCIERWLKVLL